jgi:hypothetical protein
MKSSMSGVAILVAAVCSVAVAAQSGATMAKGDAMSKMEMKDTTYTGCIEAGSTDGSFTLTHLSGDDHMAKEMTKSGAMKNDSIAKDTKETKDTIAKEHMGHDAMTPTTLNLASSSIDLRKHLSHKVSVTGSLAHEKMDAMEKDTMSKPISTFNVKSLKMVAASCS